MPLQNGIGFVRDPVAYYIAHELGHGAYTLKHTWDQWPAMGANTTANLMDYTGGQQLWKPQWEMMRNQKWHLGWFDDEEEAMIRYDDPDCWSGKSIIWIANTPQLYKAKKLLKFDAACACQNYGNERTYYRLSDGNIFRVTTLYDGYGNVESTRYAIKLPQTDFIDFPLGRLPSDCLGCELSELGSQITVYGVNYVARYCLPVAAIVGGVVALVGIPETAGASVIGYAKALQMMLTAYTAVWSIGGGTVRLTLELGGDHEAAQQIPTDFFSGTIGLICLSAIDDEVTQVVINASLSLVNGALVVNLGDASKLSSLGNILTITGMISPAGDVIKVLPNNLLNQIKSTSNE